MRELTFYCTVTKASAPCINAAARLNRPKKLSPRLKILFKTPPVSRVAYNQKYS